MSGKLHVAFLWHMHQPHYEDPATGDFALPWVRLHGAAGYADMLDMALAFPQMKLGFNLVPSLMDQVDDILDRGKRDLCFRLTEIPARELTHQDREQIVRYFFMANRRTMIEPLPRYRKLDDQRAAAGKQGASLARQLSDADFLDLQTLFNLAWTGFSARREYPELRELIAKGRGFTEEDKRTVLDLHLRMMARTRDRYIAAAKGGLPEFTTSPYYHPILPLLADTDAAARCQPESPRPRRMRAPEEARWHLREAQRRFQEISGSPARGLWPSEGAVSPEVIPLAREAGFEWLATDENNIARSRIEGAFEPNRPWLCEADGREMTLIGRHHALSDAFGFQYHRTAGPSAIAHFMETLRRIPRGDTGDPALVAIILDGENPWEHYEGRGEPFLRELYQTLSSTPWIATTTISGFLREYPAKRRIRQLHSGSWVDSNFRIWIGGGEENTAWEALGAAHARLSEWSQEHDGERGELAWRRLRIAEGSDWFWWYGDKFDSGTDSIYDRLFRANLAEVYRLIGEEIPETLYRPIRQPGRLARVEPPFAAIAPDFSSPHDSYFSWHGAGKYLPGPGGAMAQPGLLRLILYGASDRDMYLRITLGEHANDRQMLRIRATAGTSADILIALERGGDGEVRAVAPANGGVRAQALPYGVVRAAIPLSLLNLDGQRRVRLTVELMRDGLVIEQHPPDAPLEIDMESNLAPSRRWLV